MIFRVWDGIKNLPFEKLIPSQVPFLLFGTVFLSLKKDILINLLPSQLFKFAFGTVLLSLKVHHIKQEHTVPNQFFVFEAVSKHDQAFQEEIRRLRNGTALALMLNQINQTLISMIQPSGASTVPIWMPVSVSLSFVMTGPISSMPEANLNSLP